MKLGDRDLSLRMIRAKMLEVVETLSLVALDRTIARPDDQARGEGRISDRFALANVIEDAGIARDRPNASLQ
jgi:hypothetical protein